MADPEEIDTGNKFMVGVLGGDNNVVVMRPPQGPLSVEQAHNLAAYLVALSGGDRERFLKVLDAVENT